MFNHLLRYQGNTLVDAEALTYYVDSSGRLTLGSHGVLRPVLQPVLRREPDAGPTLTY